MPVPTVLERSQIRIGDRKLFERIDAYSAPRLAEYFDPDPCRAGQVRGDRAPQRRCRPPSAATRDKRRDQALGVTVEASYTVGEYDIVILSGTQSDGLETWLRENGYRIPKGAAAALRPYIRQQMKFFVAKVNLEEQAQTGVSYLRPLQFAFESDRFMLPVRLGMLNARGPQDLVLYVLTANGRVETTNYRTVKVPANMDLPGLRARRVRARPTRRSSTAQAAREDYRAIFTEYFWDMSWCDPCAGRSAVARGAAPGRRVTGSASGASRGGGAAGHAHAPAPALHARLAARGPRVPGDAGPRELPGALRAAPSVERRRRRVRSAKPYFDVRAGAAGARSADARVAHRLGHRGRSARAWHCRRSTPVRWWESMWK